MELSFQSLCCQHTSKVDLGRRTGRGAGAIYSLKSGPPSILLVTSFLRTRLNVTRSLHNMSRHRNTDKKDRSEIPPATGTLKIDLKITLWRDQFQLANGDETSLFLH